MSDYSYSFVVKSLIPALQRLGHCQHVSSPESCLVYAAARAVDEGFRPVHLAVMPVHAAYLTPAVPTILFPFWEFPGIPDRDFGWDTRQNWARIARRASMIVTACEMTARAFRQAGVVCPVEVVPVPVGDNAFLVPPWSAEHTWRMTCRHVSWGGPPPKPGESPASSPVPRPGRLASWAELGKKRYKRHIRPLLSFEAQQWISRSKRSALQALRRRLPKVVEPMPRLTPMPLELSGLVYTSVFNFGDLRKNPRDLLTAFLLAFKDRPDVTLVLKLATRAETEIPELANFTSLLSGLGIDYQCQIVVITEYLSDDELLELFRATTFYVNTSRAEGACLPLQQSLASGRPAIAPAQTAMADYMDDRVGFVVASHPEPTHWPHDPQTLIETNWQRLVWTSLRDQFLRSARMVAASPTDYQMMAEAGQGRIKSYASVDVVTQTFRRALDHLSEAPLGALGWEEDCAA
jgi:glycosyltransferase involved in cell wall biosynthesis